MKKTPITRIIVYGIISVLLLAVLMAGIALRQIRSTKPVKIQPANMYTDDNYSAYSAGSGIAEIQIDWAVGNVTVSTGDVDEVTVTAYGGTPEINASSSRLEISCNPTIILGLFSFASGDEQNLEILVPESSAFRLLEVDCASSNLKVSGLTIEKVDIDSASGNCVFENCNVGTLDMDGASQKLSFSGTLKKLDFDGASAEAEITVFNTPDSIAMDSLSGKLDLTLPEDCGFQVERDSIGGDVKIDFDTKHSGSGYTYGDGHCKIDVDGLSSSIAIHKGAAHHKEH